MYRIYGSTLVDQFLPSRDCIGALLHRDGAPDHHCGGELGACWTQDNVVAGHEGKKQDKQHLHLAFPKGSSSEEDRK
jgi:hypothetical protein